MVGNGGARQGTWVLQGRVANQKMVLGSIVSQTAKMSIRAYSTRSILLPWPEIRNSVQNILVKISNQISLDILIS